jgi:predicted membrane protein
MGPAILRNQKNQKKRNRMLAKILVLPVVFIYAVFTLKPHQSMKHRLYELKWKDWVYVLLLMVVSYFMVVGIEMIMHQ